MFSLLKEGSCSFSRETEVLFDFKKKDEEGVLRHEWRGLKIPGHVQDVLKAVIDL